MPETEVGGGAGVHDERDLVIGNPQGLHLRPATEFARLVRASGCRVRVQTDQGDADGGSVLELAMLALPLGSRLHVTIDGMGARELGDRLAGLVEGPDPS